MNSLRQKVIDLRLEGYSYNEINLKLGVPKSTLSNWLYNIKLSEKAIKRLKDRVHQGALNGFIKRNKQQTVLAKERANNIINEAKKEVFDLNNKDLLIIGAVLYWAEGYKRLKIRNGRELTAHTISLTNSDPDIVKYFIIFLERIVKVPKDRIFIDMRLFKHIDEDIAIKYWMKVSGLPREQFHKPQYPISKSSKGIRPINRLPYGTVQVIVSDTKLFYKIIGFIEGIKEKIVKIK